MFNPWLAGLDAARLAVEAQQVIGLRTMLLARGGPRAALEMQRMVAEKMLALWASQAAAAAAVAAGGPAIAGKAAAPYRRAVRANRRRLARARK
jgi:hypothetical protein